jgi:large conductance mechanosensitive channel
MDVKQEFTDFLKKYNVIGMAIGIVMGTAVTKLVSSVVSDLVMPFLGIMIPGGNWREIELIIGNLHLKLGNFMGSVLDFVIIAFVVFMFTKMILKDSAEKA